MSTKLDDIAGIIRTASRAKKAMNYLAVARIGVAVAAAVTAGVYALRLISHGK